MNFEQFPHTEAESNTEEFMENIIATADKVLALEDIPSRFGSEIHAIAQELDRPDLSASAQKSLDALVRMVRDELGADAQEDANITAAIKTLIHTKYPIEREAHAA